jgi:hypothetical protein
MRRFLRDLKYAIKDAIYAPLDWLFGFNVKPYRNHIKLTDTACDCPTKKNIDALEADIDRMRRLGEIPADTAELGKELVAKLRTKQLD